MKKFNYYLNIFCSSFTVATLVISLVNILSSDKVPTAYIWVFQMAVLCAVITILIFITGILSEKIFKNTPVWVFILTGLTEVLLSVFILGGLCFGWFPFNSFGILTIAVIDIVIYFLVYGIMYIGERKSADNINKILQNSRKNKLNSRRNKDGKDN